MMAIFEIWAGEIDKPAVKTDFRAVTLEAAQEIAVKFWAEDWDDGADWEKDIDTRPGANPSWSAEMDETRVTIVEVAESPAQVAPKSIRSTIYLVSGEHWEIPGRQLFAFTSQVRATAKASQLVNDLLKEAKLKPLCVANMVDLELATIRLQQRKGSRTYVEIDEIDLHEEG